ncbi:MAG: type II secretion system protein M [Pseudomonadales bacterium]|nr:type II secretion system protein M [Pseudomonadales bacterium]
MTEAADGLAAVSQQIAELKVKYYSLSVRDRGALLALTIFLLCVMFFYFVWSPIQDGADEAFSRYQSNTELMAWMKANESVAKKASSSSNSANRGGKSILSLVNTTAGRNGIALKRFEPKGEDGLRIWLESVPFDAMLKWLGTMNSSYGIEVSNITVETQDEIGLVNATIILAG